MSQKRRQEVLESFSKPLKDDDYSSTQPAAASASATQKRRTGRAAKIILDSDEEDAIDQKEDADFVVHSDSDDSFLDDREAALPWNKNKGKGKGKGKAKKAKGSKGSSSYSNGGNPKVLLISLKAGALGLNLTVANNVYLWVHYFLILHVRLLTTCCCYRMDP